MAFNPYEPDKSNFTALFQLSLLQKSVEHKLTEIKYWKYFTFFHCAKTTEVAIIRNRHLYIQEKALLCT